MIITSPANERLKHARRVRDGDEPDLIFIEGERLVEECLQSNLRLFACFHSLQPSPRAQKIISSLAQIGCPLYPSYDAVLETLSDTINTQGLIVLAERPNYTLDQIISQPEHEALLIVCLDTVQDPGNLGTIIRTAEAAGANGVVALKGSVDPFTPKALRSTMGSAFRLPVVSHVEPDELFEKTQIGGIGIVATSADAAVPYDEFDLRPPLLIIFGNEAHGVRIELLERCEARLRIPLRPPVESLNVAASAAVVLFEVARQRRIKRE
ncbi:MAG: RNA methyltransferase [Acidobacteria bacterium]|nr:RNA methyltransferase [Acidobacteriota bacterium]